MVQDLEYIKRWFKDNKVNKFIVFKKENKEKSERANGGVLTLKGDEPIEEKLARLEDFFNNDGGGYYTIVQNGEGNSDNSELDIFIPYNNGNRKFLEQAPTTPQNQIGTIPDGYFSQREFETKLENERLKLRVEKLENEVNDYKKEATEANNASNEFYKQVTPFIAPVLKGLLGGFSKQAVPTQIGTLQAENTDDNDLDISEDEFRQLTEDLKRWANADSDYLTLIHELSLFTTNPMYLTAKGMLLKKE